jgi:hypothetical protein
MNDLSAPIHFGIGDDAVGDIGDFGVGAGVIAGGALGCCGVDGAGLMRGWRSRRLLRIW